MPATCSAAAGRRFLGSFNHGSMANALPQAIGAQLAYPARQVISLSGDGGLAMLMGELLTVAQYQLPVKIVLFNNHRLGMVQLEMEAAGLPHYGCELKNPNFAALAQAVGLMGLRVEDPAEVRPALEQALASKRAGPGGRGDRPERPGHAAEGDGPAGRGIRPGDDQDGVHGRGWRRSRHVWPTGGT